MTEKIYINWNEFHSDVKALAQQLEKRGQFNRIVAVSRGGLVPAGILAYELNIRNCEAINISSYDNESKRDDTEIEIGTVLHHADEHTLIVDDLADSGRTLQILHKLYPSATLACVYVKPEGQKYCNIYAKQLPNQWVVFPWD